MNSSRIALRLREQIAHFSGELSRDLPKTAQRFVGEMLYGIQARQSVLLTEVARSLEEPIQMKKSYERLSRQLSRKGLAERIEGNLLPRAPKEIKVDTLLIIDPTDISKKHAMKMQYLAKVRDGSSGQIREGHWVCSVQGPNLNVKISYPYINVFILLRRPSLSARMMRFSDAWAPFPVI